MMKIRHVSTGAPGHEPRGPRRQELPNQDRRPSQGLNLTKGHGLLLQAARAPRAGAPGPIRARLVGDIESATQFTDRNVNLVPFFLGVAVGVVLQRLLVLELHHEGGGYA